MKVYFDLIEELYVDTYLSVKYSKEDGKTVFVHYAIPRKRKNGTFRSYGDLYNYFTQKKGFRFAIGYILEEDESGKFWKAQNQYFYFDKNELPYNSFKELKNSLFLLKNNSYKPQTINHK